MSGIQASAGIANVLSNYEAKTFTVTTGTTDYDVATNNTNMFGGAASKLTAQNKQRNVIKIVSNQDITVKYNQTTNDGILVKSSESPYYETFINAQNVFITNTSGSTATITMVCYYVN